MYKELSASLELSHRLKVMQPLVQELNNCSSNCSLQEIYL